MSIHVVYQQVYACLKIIGVCAGLSLDKVSTCNRKIYCIQRFTNLYIKFYQFLVALIHTSTSLLLNSNRSM